MSQRNPEKLVQQYFGKSLKANLRNSICLYKDCKKNAINSHSISKSLLQTIAKDNEVYTFLPTSIKDKIFLGDMSNISLSKTTIKPRENGATCFKGFCSEHDTNLFRCIEYPELLSNIKLDDYAFLYSYRNTLYNYWLEKALVNNKNLNTNPMLKSQESNIKIINRIVNESLGLDSLIKELYTLKQNFELYIENNGKLNEYNKSFLVYTLPLVDDLEIKFAGITTCNILLSKNFHSNLPITIGILPEYKNIPNIFFVVAHVKDKPIFDLLKESSSNKYFIENIMLYKNQNLVIGPALYNKLATTNEIECLYEYLTVNKKLDLEKNQGFDLFS